MITVLLRRQSALLDLSPRFDYGLFTPLPGFPLKIRLTELLLHAMDSQQIELGSGNRFQVACYDFANPKTTRE
jgi:hypothetical protein